MRQFLGWALLAVLLGVPVAAQTPADTLELSLERALAIATGSNPGYRQAVNSAGLNPVEWRTTWFSEVLPQAQVTLFQTQYTGNLTRRATDNFGNPIERPVTDWTYFSQTNQSLSLTWSIQGASVAHALDRQRYANLDRTLAEDGARVSLGVSVRRAFWDVLEQRDLLRAEEALLQGRELDLEVARRLFGLAMRTRVDVLNAELAVEQQALGLRQQRAARAQALLALRTELGDEDLPPLRLTETPVPVFDPSSLSAEVLVARALNVNPGIRRAEVAMRSAEVDRAASRRAWWPEFFLNYRLGRTAQTPEAEALFDVSFDEDLDQRFGVGLSIPMFTDYFGNRQEQHRASVAVQNRREEARAAELQTRQEVRAALLELENQHESLRLAERSAEIAAEALRLAREEYRLGSRSFEDLRSAFDAEAGTRRQVIQARHAFVDARLSLEDAVGAPVGPASGPSGG